MYQAAPSQRHLQLAPPPYPGNEGNRNAPPYNSLFGGSDNGSNWSDSESEESAYQDDRASTGANINTVSRRQRPLRRTAPGLNETYAGQGDWDEHRYPSRSGGQAVPYNHQPKLYVPARDPYSQPPPPLDPHPQVQHHRTQSGPLPPAQNNMAHENPFAPRSVPWNGYQAGPYGNNPPAPVHEPHQPVWPPAADYVLLNPAHFPTVPPNSYPYPDPRMQYHGGNMSAQNPPDPPPAFEPAPPPRRRRRRPQPAEAPAQEHDLDHLQRRLRAVEIDTHHEKGLRQARREREEAERQKWEMDAKVDRLRQDIERSFKADIRDAVDDICREIQMAQSESHSEPGRTPSRMDGGGRGGYAAPVRSVRGDRGIWTVRDAEGQDVLMREMEQLIEGKRRLHPQEHAPGAAFRNGQAGSGSARGSRIDPELRSELETIVYNIIGGSDVAYRPYRRPSSRSVHGRAASHSFHPRTATQADPRDWRQDMYDGGVDPAMANPYGLRRSPVRVAFEQNAHGIPHVAPARPADERDWVGVPRRARRPRPRREDAGGPSAPQTQGAGPHQQPPPPQQASNTRRHTGADAPDPRARGEGGGGGGEAVFSARARAYQDSINNNGARQGGPGPGRPARPVSQGGEYGHAATYGDQDAGAFLTDDESDDPEVFPKRNATYPEFPAGHPDLRHSVDMPWAPEPEPYLQQAGL